MAKELNLAICSLSGAPLPMRPSIHIANIKRTFDKSKSKTLKIMAKPKYDYDSDFFYQRIQESADRQMQENHIIWDKVIAQDLGFEVATTFSEMKNGQYRPWTKDENERRSKRINEVLSRARASVEPEVWRMILEMGLGKVQAQDITFDKIGDKIQDEQRITVHKLPPNLNALQMWLRHHSQAYRCIERGEKDIDDGRIDGIDINVVYNKKEDLELQGNKNEQTES